MATGAFYFYDRNLLKLFDGTIDLDSATFKAVLSTSTQALARGFTGASGNALYADLTNELGTANGYTAGGFTLVAPTLSRPSAAVVQFTCNTWFWTLTGGGVTAKYLSIYVSSTANQELLLVSDLDTTGGSVIALAGPLQVTPDSSGLARATQP